MKYIYVKLIKKQLLTLEQVPLRWQAEVAALLEEDANA